MESDTSLSKHYILKERNKMKFATIRKTGLFYQVFDDDALILHFLLNYKVIGEDIEKNFKDLNKYDFYLAKSKDKIVVQDLIKNIELKLESKYEVELLQILEGIERIVNE